MSLSAASMVKTRNGLGQEKRTIFFLLLGVSFVVSVSVQLENLPVTVCSVCDAAQNAAEICCAEKPQVFEPKN